ncbi:MAG: hypothetical protein ACR2P1_00080 [Pseudomonadales bacterium]
MNDDNIDTIIQVRDFLSGTREISFTLENKEQRYQFIRRTPIRFRYYNLPKPDKSILLGYLTHMTVICSQIEVRCE